MNDKDKDLMIIDDNKIIVYYEDLEEINEQYKKLYGRDLFYFIDSNV